MPPKKSPYPQTPSTSFKRYCEYEGMQSLTNSRAHEQHEHEQVQTQIIMFPLPRQARSKTAFATRGLSFKNIGQNIQMRPKLGQRNVYSRENIQSMNKKLKQLKQSMFSSANLQPKVSDKNSPVQIKLSGFSSMITSFTLAGKNKRNIHSCTQLRSSLNPQSMVSTAPGTDSLFPKAQPRIRPHHKSSKHIQKAGENGPTVRPNNFKATLKQKHIDDNPKVLANIIRKKVECMKTEEVHQYIHSLMRRGKE